VTVSYSVCARSCCMSDLAYQHQSAEQHLDTTISYQHCLTHPSVDSESKGCTGLIYGFLLAPFLQFKGQSC